MVHGSDTLIAHRSQVALGAVHDAIAELLAAVAQGAVRDLTHTQHTELVAAAGRAQARLESAVLTVVGEVDAGGGHVHDGALTTGAWLRMHTRATPAEAAATVRTARVLRAGTLPGTAAALAEGDISARHAQVIATAAADAPAGAAGLIEPEALAAARTADVRAVAAVMRRFAHALDPDAADEAAVARYDRRGLTLAPTLNGSLSISGLADEVTGSTIATAIDTAAPLVTGDTRSAAQRRLDALGEICRRYLDHPDTAPTGSGRSQVIVTCDDTTLHEHPAPDTPGPDTAGPAPGSPGRRGPPCPGSARSGPPPPAGSAATRRSPPSRSDPTGRSPPPAPTAATSPAPNAGR